MDSNGCHSTMFEILEREARGVVRGCGLDRLELGASLSLDVASRRSSCLPSTVTPSCCPSKRLALWPLSSSSCSQAMARTFRSQQQLHHDRVNATRMVERLDETTKHLGAGKGKERASLNEGALANAADDVTLDYWQLKALQTVRTRLPTCPERGC